MQLEERFICNFNAPLASLDLYLELDFGSDHVLNEH